jgi:hypothetical protein
LSHTPRNVPMRIKQLIPDDGVRSKVLALAAARGIPAVLDGICVYFDLPRGSKGLATVSAVMKAAGRSVLILEPLAKEKQPRSARVARPH